MSKVPPIVPSWLARWAEGTLGLEEQEIDPLVLPSGQIVACDPFVALGARPFARSVPKGRYKVVLSLSGRHVALACVRFGRAKVARWEVATFAGSAPRDGLPGYGVDSGTGCFVDAEVAARHVARERARHDARYDAVSEKLRDKGVDPQDPSWHEAYEAELEDDEADLLTRMGPSLNKRGWASLALDEEGGNLLAFRSGVGDGVYASYWGLDSRGRPAVLITDFDLLDAEEEDEDQKSEDEVDDVDLEDAELYAMALKALRREAAPAAPAASPLLPRAKKLVAHWESSGKMELEEDCDRDAFAEALLEKLVALEGHRHVGSHLAEWLMERGEVVDVFASDDELEADVRSS